MTKLMEKAIEALRSLPEETQDAVAGSVLWKLEDDRKWEQTTEDHAAQVDKLVAEVLEADRRGETEPLDADGL
jgi:hypothetical protein